MNKKLSFLAVLLLVVGLILTGCPDDHILPFGLIPVPEQGFSVTDPGGPGGNPKPPPPPVVVPPSADVIRTMGNFNSTGGYHNSWNYSAALAADLADADYLIVQTYNEVASSDGIGTMQVVFQSGGDGWVQNETMGGTASFNRGADENIYFIVRLADLTGYYNFANVTQSWGSFALHLEDGAGTNLLNYPYYANAYLVKGSFDFTDGNSVDVNLQYQNDAGIVISYITVTDADLHDGRITGLPLYVPPVITIPAEVEFVLGPMTENDGGPGDTAFYGWDISGNLTEFAASKYLIIQTFGWANNQWGFQAMHIKLTANGVDYTTQLVNNWLNLDRTPATTANNNIYIVIELDSLIGYNALLANPSSAYIYLRNNADGGVRDITAPPVYRNAYLVSGEIVEPAGAALNGLDNPVGYATNAALDWNDPSNLYYVVGIVKDLPGGPPVPVPPEIVLELGGGSGFEIPPAGSSGWGSGGWNINSSDFADAEYLVIQLYGNSDNAWGFGGLQIELDSDNYFYQTTTIDGWLDLVRGATDDIYIVVVLDSLNGHSDVVTDTGIKLALNSSTLIYPPTFVTAFLAKGDIDEPSSNIAILNGTAEGFVTNYSGFDFGQNGPPPATPPAITKTLGDFENAQVDPNDDSFQNASKWTGFTNSNFANAKYYVIKTQGPGRYPTYFRRTTVLFNGDESWQEKEVISDTLAFDRSGSDPIYIVIDLTTFPNYTAIIAGMQWWGEFGIGSYDVQYPGTYVNSYFVSGDIVKPALGADTVDLNNSEGILGFVTKDPSFDFGQGYTPPLTPTPVTLDFSTDITVVTGGSVVGTQLLGDFDPSDSTPENPDGAFRITLSLDTPLDISAFDTFTMDYVNAGDQGGFNWWGASFNILLTFDDSTVRWITTGYSGSPLELDFDDDRPTGWGDDNVTVGTLTDIQIYCPYVSGNDPWPDPLIINSITFSKAP